MIVNPHRAGTTILALALCLGLASCESEKARAAATQFAFSWETTVKVMGLAYLSDLQETEKQSRSIEPTREAIHAEGSEAMWREAQQLDTLVLYVARCLDTNIRANIARPEGEAGRPPISVEFPDARLNGLLGLDSSAGENPQAAVVALHKAIDRFADTVGVGKEFRQTKERREQTDGRTAKDDGTEPGWPKIREAKMRTASERKTKLAGERALIETEVRNAKAPPGFSGAKWLMSPEEVKHVRPNATPEDPGYMSEIMDWIGRPVRVRYCFDNGFLVTVVVTFRETTAGDFEKTQNALQNTHGTMPALRKGGDFLLSSDHKMGRFSVWHVLQLSNIEQVIYARNNPSLIPGF